VTSILWLSGIHTGEEALSAKSLILRGSPFVPGNPGAMGTTWTCPSMVKANHCPSGAHCGVSSDQ
jgi:hypothetical protein